ncbi:hypothetical protein GCM10010844_38060 [Deinococcus radiotolerans]|uniref:Uncharacterized protein n=1 Tax=Deinococcus radiotolerans TaxID=1309407 RepID=A0ABQ2FQ43_9DEIO|nr:hypothetical protein GCM10010844_38060 [Deinococcus radiotolerans]
MGLKGTPRRRASPIARAIAARNEAGISGVLTAGVECVIVVSGSPLSCDFRSLPAMDLERGDRLLGCVPFGLSLLWDKINHTASKATGRAVTSYALHKAVFR